MIGAAFLFAVSGYVIEAHGDVSLHRHEALHASPASVGSVVHVGDTIRPANGAIVRILCPDLLTTWQPASRAESGVFEGCPRREERPRVRDGQPVLGVRAIEPAPWIRTPSNTAITTVTSVLRWEPVPGATRYRVTILEVTNPPRPIWGPALVEGTTIQYTGGHALGLGMRYFVRVEANGARAEGQPFFVAGAELQKEMQERGRHFDRTIADQRGREIAMSVYLRSRELRADALSVLERIAVSAQSPALKLLYARCLGEVGDVGAQWDVLQSALNDAQRNRDAYTEAMVLLELARLSPKREESQQLSQRAKNALQTLGLRQAQGDD